MPAGHEHQIAGGRDDFALVLEDAEPTRQHEGVLVLPGMPVHWGGEDVRCEDVLDDGDRSTGFAAGEEVAIKCHLGIAGGADIRALLVLDRRDHWCGHVSTLGARTGSSTYQKAGMFTAARWSVR